MLNNNILSVIVAVIFLSLSCSPAIAAINYTRLGTGTGFVTFAPGASCPNNCSQNYDSGTQVTLTATPSANSIFTGWSGACSGTEGCTLTVDGEKQVTATFSATTSILATAAGYYHNVAAADMLAFRRPMIPCWATTFYRSRESPLSRISSSIVTSL